MHNIQIDSEFQALIPPLSAEERAQLEANLLADGCRDPLVVWVQPAPEPGAHKCYAHDESKCDLVPEDDVWHCRHCEHNPAQQEYVLIDGHNRYEICTRNGIEYSIEEMLFDDRDAVMDWMDANQLGRRNLTRDQFTLLIGRRYNRVKKAAHSGANQHTEVTDKMSTTTAETLATDYGVTERTVRRAGQFADAVEAINNAAPGFTASVNAGAAPTRQEVVKAATVVAQIPEAAQNVALAAEFADLPSEAKQEAFEAIAQLAPAQEVMREAVKKAHVANNSGNNEWYTPPKFIELARQAMGGIDLDPATSEVANRTVQAPKIFTADDDGRAQQWSGRVWMNPPYAQPLMGDFAEAVASKYESGEIDQACVLVNNGTETQWFQRMLGAADAVCFPKTRIKFLDPEGSPSGAPLQGQAILYMGGNVDAFARLFAEEGVVLTHA